MKTAIVILNWNGKEYLKRFLPGLVDSIGAGEESFWDALTSNGYTIVILLQPIVILLEIMLAYYYQKGRSSSDPSNDSRFMMYCMLGATSVFLWTPAPTYMMIIIPFVTHGTGGLSETITDLTQALPESAQVREPIGVYRPQVDAAQPAIQEWLASSGY